MTHLNLSYSQFSGPIPLDMISQLSSLITLDLSYINPLITIGDDHSLRRLVGNLTQLRELVLDGVGMSRISLVSLSNLSSTLTSLSLQQCSLTGTLPNNIFHLPRLRSLSLYANSDLIGSLPQTNWSTSSLVSLVLSDTKFHGPIPASVGNLTSMKILDLSYAKFTGPIPLTLGNLAHLTDLDLGSNTLGSTMEFEMFARLKSLQLLSLQYNNLSVLLQSNGNCSFPMLKVLMLSSCRLTGATFPYFLNSSAELEELDLSRNMISGGIPDWIGRVGRDTLALLDLSSNNFTREIPSSICQLSSLSDLDLFDNGFSGSIPSYNRISDTFPQGLLNATLHSLMGLSLQSNKFHGVINEIPLPPLLKDFGVSDNHFSGPFPTNFFRNSSVYFIDLTDNDFDGLLPIPPPTVQYLSVANNKFGGDIPYELCNATELYLINLSNNSFTGTIPPCFPNLNLSVLDLRANKFVGQIPDIFPPGNILRTIRLSQNRLGGTVPRSLVHCKELEVLDLSENELGGRFPHCIPSSVGNLTNLEWLDLSSNKLNGKIPGELADVTFLTTLNLSNNLLSGPIPKGPQIDTFVHSFDGNPGLCGHPLPTACGLDGLQSPPTTSPAEEEEEESAHWIEWRAVAIGYGSGLVIGISAGYIMLEIGRPRWLEEH
ncbi:hypothetical protein CRG98_015456 [Punica granatum]|uniref:Uncharacterized protein n=1 Tax=Punica granatum TaxID=22663 RepID=A0A2I0K6D5_PUNGR|nr:hypothetical protein CRG98_015456 [Punica granatum]